jgi:hypothetical protein
MRKHSKSKLYQDVADRLERWKIGNQYPIVADEFEHKLLPSTRSNDIKTAIRHCSLDHLLYQYRNSLVHEFISPAGVTSDDPTITEPFYYSLQGGGLATAKPWYTWELVVPVEFLKLLVQAVLNNLNSERINNPFNWKDLLKPPKYQRRRMFPWRKF